MVIEVLRAQSRPPYTIKLRNDRRNRVIEAETAFGSRLVGSRSASARSASIISAAAHRSTV